MSAIARADGRRPDVTPSALASSLFCLGTAVRKDWAIESADELMSLEIADVGQKVKSIPTDSAILTCRYAASADEGSRASCSQIPRYFPAIFQLLFSIASTVGETFLGTLHE